MESAAALLLLCGVWLPAASALDNGLALTPPMGWLSWQQFHCAVDCVNGDENCVSEDALKTVADLLVEKGYSDLGYNHVIVDDCWLSHERDSEGRLQPDPDRFPSGMKALGDYIHGKGLLYGIYEDIGTKTCAGYPGLQGHFQIDAQTLAAWGADYLKIDGCNEPPDQFPVDHPAFGAELNATGRPIVYSCEWPLYEPEPHNYTAIAATCNLWRNYDDVGNSWHSIKDIAARYTSEQEHFSAAGPGAWFDPDMLIIGTHTDTWPGLTAGQSRVQMALWSIWAAPLIMSNDLRDISDDLVQILQNTDVIAVDQDALGVMGRGSAVRDDVQIWHRPVLPDGSCAVVVVNYADSEYRSASFSPAQVGCSGAPGGYHVTELFTKMDFGVLPEDSVITSEVPGSDCVMFKLTAV